MSILQIVLLAVAAIILVKLAILYFVFKGNGNADNTSENPDIKQDEDSPAT